MRTIVSMMCVLLLVTVAVAQEGARKQAADISRKAFASNQEKYAGDKDVLVKPGLLADRKAGTVKLWSVATSVKADDPIEFLLIASDSGKDYESLAMTFASLKDVNEALEFIGLKAGRAVDYANRRYWARGETVAMKFGWTDAQGKAQEAAVQTLLRNPQTDKGWETRLVYTGSRWVTTPDGQKIWLAGVDDAAAIASTYSNPAGLLDVADRSSQGDVYGSIKPLEKMPITPDQSVVVTLTRSGKLSEVDWVLAISEQSGKMQVQLGEEPATDWIATLAKIEQVVGEGKVPFVTIAWADDLKVSDAIKAAALLGKLEGPRGIRIEPPPAADRLYYRAFLPDPKWRDPTKRVFNGWDITLPLDAATDSITAVERADSRDETTGQFATVAKSHTLANPDELNKLLTQGDGQRPRDVYVHVPGNMTVGRLHAMLAPCLSHHPTVYVFTEK